MKEIETRKEFRKTYHSRSEYCLGDLRKSVCLDHDKNRNQRSRSRRLDDYDEKILGIHIEKKKGRDLIISK